MLLRLTVLVAAVVLACVDARAPSATTEWLWAVGRVTITGDLVVGATLTGHEQVDYVKDGEGGKISSGWTVSQRVWARCEPDESWCGGIGAALDSSTYTLQPADVGCTLKYSVAYFYQGQPAGAILSEPFGPLEPGHACVHDTGPPPPPPPPVEPLVFRTTELPTGTAGSTYSFDALAIGGRRPYAFALTSGALPEGIALTAEGNLAGKPFQEGVYAFGLRVTDADGRSASATFTIVVFGRYDLAGTDIPKGPALILPSPAETPGVRNPSVRQANVGTTICSRRWLARVRPAPSYLVRLKPTLLARYGETDPPDRYLADHLIPVELGGHPTSRWNLWPEPHYQARASHALETSLHRKVCAGTLRLAAAQRSIVEFKRENG